MIDVLLESLIDTIKVIPYLFVTFLILEYLEHKLSKKSYKSLVKYRKVGPAIGSILGCLPQCGFSAVASELYSSSIITTGTLIAVFLATSDEMIPLMISESFSFKTMLLIISFKVIIAIIIGLIVDMIYKKKLSDKDIFNICKDDHCDCEHHNIFVSSLIHTLKITVIILIANLIIGLLIDIIGPNTLKYLLIKSNIFTYFIASLIGLIPNCAASVILTEVYMANIITIGMLLSGLLTSAGIGLVVLFKNNKNIKENLGILATIYLVGVIIGILVDIIL